MIKIVCKNVIWGFLAVLITILVSGTIQTWAANPNLDGNSHPTRLTVNECIADVKEITDWDEKKVLDAARKICESRQSHAKQKARFLASLKKLQEQNYRRFDEHLPTAIEDSWTIVKSCIDFKEGFTSSHNVAVLSVPENVRSSCYSLGASLVESAPLIKRSE
ncbi:MAG: hypothetical protein RMY64_11580 [Nostoc sp. DedQUE08]|uniref:hypothetical protein n=1 Tax=Nostoc sp. DedQUE08 TaxID=3075393 RepID=UPI002AD4E607|nr:hypothetical protein [Nostoc sp. DedQUE08]MDZ8066262.1 hypothetical protein [Nostoc sp. DedQUE08]